MEPTMHSVKDVVENPGMRLLVRAVVHRISNLITPSDSKKSQYRHVLLVDQTSCVSVTIFLPAHARSNLEVGHIYECDMSTHEKGNSFTTRLHGSKDVTVRNPELKAWYDEEYRFVRLDRTSCIPQLRFRDGTMKENMRVNLTGKVIMVGSEIMCQNGVSMISYSIAYDTGNISISVFGNQKKLAMNDTVFFRNVRYKGQNTFTMDELAEMFGEDASDELPKSCSQESYSMNLSSSQSPSKKLKIDAVTDPFFEDLRTLYEDSGKTKIDFGKLFPVFQQEKILQMVHSEDLIRILISVFEHRNLVEALKFAGKVFASMEATGEGERMEVQEQGEDQTPHFNSSIGQILMDQAKCIPKELLLSILSKEKDLNYEDIFILVHSVLERMNRGATRIKFKNEIMKCFEFE